MYKPQQFRPWRSGKFLVLSACLIGLILSKGLQAEDDFEVQARALHQRIISLDAHVDIPDNFATKNANPGQHSEMPIDIPKLRAGGQTGAVFSVFVKQNTRTPKNYELAKQQGLQKLASIHRMAAQHPEDIGIATSVSEVQRLHKEGKKVAVIGMLNGFSLGPDIELLDHYYQQGLRQFGFTHAGNNDLADSSRLREQYGDLGPEHEGLSGLGKKLVLELNRKGIIIDVSQLTTKAVMQVIALGKAPVIASHSAIQSHFDHPRNLSDQEMKSIADTGGVIHIVAFSGYLKKVSPELYTELDTLRAEYGVKNDFDSSHLADERRKEYDNKVLELIRKPSASVADYVDVLEKAIQLVGIDHVGISTDFGHGGGVIGWRDASKTYSVTAELLRRGYDEESIEKIWGLNWLRVFQSVEMIASDSN